MPIHELDCWREKNGRMHALLFVAALGCLPTQPLFLLS